MKMNTRRPKLSALFLLLAVAYGTETTTRTPESDVQTHITTTLRTQNADFHRHRRQQQTQQYEYQDHPRRDADADADILDEIKTATATHLGSSFNLGGHFSQGYIDLGSRDLVEDGAATLAFVFDTTGSMSDDMQQVIVGAREILNTVLEKFERPIYNYVFVPFHDPEVGPVTATTDPEEFQESMKKSHIFGGGDCPEMAIRAIKMALEISLPSSYVYVFTDARAKDYYLLEDVLQIIQKKQSQVVFVMTGDCNNHTHPGYQAFEDIASTSAGQIFHLEKGNVKEVLDFVRVSLESRKVNLLSINHEVHGPGEENLPLLIDPTLKQFTISVSGEKPKIEIYDPTGKDVREEQGVEDLLDLDNVKIVGINEPAPGQYNISVGSDSKFTVRATGVSSLRFEHGFSVYPTTNFKETYHRPMTGETSYVLVRPSDMTEFGDLFRLQLLSLDGRVLEDIPLHRLPGSLPVYNGTAFLTPDQPFNLKIFGRDKHGYNFERISPTAVSSQFPARPEVNSVKVVTGHYDQPAIITCHVHTLVPFTLTWQKNGVYLDTEHRFPQSSEVHYEVTSPSHEDEGQYTCIATNTAGTASSTVYLDVKEPPPQITAPGTVTVLSTLPALLTCHVTSSVQYNITWSHYVVKGQVQDFFGRTETIGEFVNVGELEGYQVLPNNSLLLQSPDSHDEGWFRCTAANEGGRQSREVHVTVQSPPQVFVVPEILAFRKGENVTLSCRGEGVPQPSVTWWRENTSLTEPVNASTTSHTNNFIVYSATHEDEGMYTCTATNSGGTATATTVLRYTEAPEVIPVDEEILVGNGETIKLQCVMTGTPEPSLQWFKDGSPIRPMSFLQMEGDYLKIIGVQANDGGQYTCQATNQAGIARSHISLRVGVPPTVNQPPTDSVVEIGGTGGFSCYGLGVPEPTITWYRADGHPLPPHFAQDGDGNLRIIGVQAEDEGTYVCVIENQYGSRQLQASLTVSGLLAPLVAAPLVPELEVTQGSRVTLPCVVVMANPAPHITWFYEGSLIYQGRDDMTVDEDGSLRIPSVRPKDEGRYQCVATNLAGNSSLTLTLSVIVPPRAKSNREETVVSVKGGVVRIKCPVRADPKPFFSWSKDGRPLSSDSQRLRVSRNGFIVIKQVTESDAGTYICTAKNAAGTTSIPVILQVNDKPEISPPGDETLSVLSGQDLKLPCEARGQPEPVVTWTEDEEELRETTHLRVEPGYLLMRNVTPSLAGVYTCTARNTVGEDKKVFTIHVNYAPSVEEVLEHIPETKVVEGGQLSLPCHADAYPLPTKDWSKDGEKLHPSPDLIITNAGSVEVYEAAPQHSGNYRCTLRNTIGEAYIDYDVQVIVPPQALLTNWPETTVVIEGEQVTIKCPVDAIPLPTITWLKNGVSIQSTKDRADLTHLIVGENGQMLHILEVSLRDNGTYQCVAKNDAGETEVSFNLEVLVAPEFSEFFHNPNSELRVGEELSLDCDATGNPKPQVSWLHDGSPLEEFVTEGGTRISVKEVRPRHGGLYTCTAANTAGSIQRNFSVTVLVPPIFEDKNHQNQINAVKGTETRLVCRVSGSPSPSVTWMKNGLPVSLWSDVSHEVSSDGQVLTLHGVGTESSGVYGCVAKNTLGTRHKLFNVTVLTPPSIVREDGEDDDLVEEVNVVSGEEVILHCPAEGTPEPTITWLRDERILPPSDPPHHLVLSNTQQQDSGDYTCLASNPVGSIEKQFAVKVIVPARITDLGKNKDKGESKPYQEVLVDKPFSLYCPVVGSPLPSITWSKNDGLMERPLEEDLSERIGLREDGQLLFVVGASVKDSGKYTCNAHNEGGSDSASYVVSVLVPPHITEETETETRQTYLEGEEVKLHCEVKGTPPLSIVWLLDSVGLEDLKLPGVSIEENVTLVEGNVTLVKSVVSIENVGEIHSGPFTCLASNGAGSDELLHHVEVSTPPRMEDDTKDTRVVVRVNRPGALTCHVYSNPEPEIIWFKDSEPLEGDPNIHLSLDGRELKLLQVRERDAGNYSCLAINAAGSLLVNHTLEVHVPPHLQGEVKEDVHAKAGEDVVLFCPVFATPEPSILWMNETTILEQTFTTLYPQKLVLHNVSKGDAGRYSCLATNEAGTLEQDFTLHVMTAPKLIDLEKPVVEKSVVSKHMVTVSCYVVANPPPSITWLKDGEPFTSSSIRDVKFDTEDRHVTLLRALPSDSGNYTCLATNAAGTTALTTLISVHTPPTWNTESELEENVMALEGENLDLFCDVEAIPTPSILWLKNGQVITSTLSSKYNHTHDERVLRLMEIEEGDSGRYVCVASNSAGTGKFEFQVNVLALPSLTHQPQTQHTVVQNHPLTLECPVDGNPKPDIEWLINDSPVSSSDKYIQLTGARTQLHILRVLSSMEGEISCVATNGVGDLVTNYTLDVLVPPSITPTPALGKAKVYKGGFLTLSCHASGEPNPKVSWLVGEDKVVSEEMVALGLELHDANQSLFILEANKEDQGHYTCIASNPAGSTEETFYVEVLVPPVIRRPEGGTNMTVMQSSTVSLPCVVDARPRAEITWFKDGKEIDGGRDPFLHVTGNGERLRVLRSLPSHTANYTCKAENEAGEDRISFSVQVMVAPMIIEDLVENAIGGGIGGETVGVVGRTMDLECYAYGTPTPTIAWTKDNQEVKISERVEVLEEGQVLRLHNAQTNDSGHYACTATSPSGSASRDFMVVIHKPPRIVPPSGRTLEVVMNDPVALTCEVESSLTPAVSWIRHGQPITPFLNPNFQVLSDGRELHIQRVRTGDGGAFTCVAVNAAGQDTLTYNVVVQVPALIERANVQSKVIGVTGQSVEFVCDASGSPKPTMSWSHDSLFINLENPRYQILDKGNRLEVKEVMPRDEGVISCSAKNSAGHDTLNFTLDVMVPPYLPSEAVTDVTVKEGDSIILECPAEATPSPSVTWSRDGSTVDILGKGNINTEGNGRWLRVVRAGSHNGGVYTCTATNLVGLLDVAVFLNVLVLPEIVRGRHSVVRQSSLDGVKEMEVVTVTEGGHAVLECHLKKGSPSPTRTWTLYPNTSLPVHFKVMGAGERAVVSQTSVQDAGVYKCVARNSAGQDSKLVKLEVYSSPRINMSALPSNFLIPRKEKVVSALPPPTNGHPQNSTHSAVVTTTHGQTITLPCPVTGNPPPRRLWYQGSHTLVSSPKQVIGAGGRDLTLVGAEPRDAGVYVCVAVNPAGEAQLTTSLHVITIPELEGETKEELMFVEGESAILECKVKPQSSLVVGPSIQPHYNITWTKSGQVLKRDTPWKPEPDILNDSPTILDFYDVLESTTFDPVMFEDLSSAISLRSTTYLEEEDGGGDGGDTEWYTISVDGSRLFLPKIAKKEEGMYSCLVSNEAGTTHRTFRLDVLVPPDIQTIERPSRYYNVTVGDPVVLECDAQGNPPPQVIWFHEESRLSPTSRLQMLEDGHILLFTNVEEDDDGNYTCEAVNVVGATDETFRLQVFAPPRVSGPLDSTVAVVSGQPVEIVCDVTGRPKPDITWTHNGDEVVTGNRDIITVDSHLIIERTSLDHGGNYQCEAINSVGHVVKTFRLQVQEPPVIVRGVNDGIVTVVEGESTSLHCFASGNPQPTITWTKVEPEEGDEWRHDGFTASHPHKGTNLDIQSVKEEDSGTYICTASNVAGNDTKEYLLQVLVKPELREAEDEIKVVSGETVTLHCTFSGYPQPQITWYFKEELIDTGEEASGELQVSSVDPSNGGNYTCVADNEAGQDTHTIRLIVYTPPSLEAERKEVVALKGTQVTLSCRVEGNPPPVIRWLKAHQIIRPSTEFVIRDDGSLHVPVVLPSHADTYVCSGQNPAGSSSDHMQLVVQEPPVAESDEGNEVIVTEGQKAVINCDVTGSPPPTITWARPDMGHTPVTPEDPRVKILGKQLIISSIMLEDAGGYECTAHNPAGHTSVRSQLNVLSPPSVKEAKNESVTLKRGEELRLSCTVSGHPQPRISWLKDGRILSDTPRVLLQPNGDVVVSRMQASDSGIYTCLATNLVGRLYRDAHVEVLVPPNFVILPRSTRVTQGQRFELECEAVGNPSPSIHWLLNGVEIDGVAASLNGWSHLVVEHASKGDEGTYTCLAKNEAGHKKAIAGVQVKVPPVIMYGPEETTVLELSAVTLVCVAEGDPVPSTTWIKEGHSLQTSDRVKLTPDGSLVINASQASDAGEYKCVVSNDAGAAEATAHLVVHTAPVIATPPVAKVVDVGAMVVFDCVAEGSPTPEIQWNVSPGDLHSRFQKLTNGSLQLIAAQMEDEGQVICQAYNDLGEDLAKADLYIKVPGFWGSWESWSSCSVSCGPGQQVRRRQCDSPTPRHGGAPCSGDDAQVRPCRPQPCPVDGNWSPWEPWGECSVTCGEGVQVRSRYCTAPVPLYGGKHCEGNGTQEQTCNPRDCPVAGQWGEWSVWSECSTTCGQGLQQRSRLCDSPTPSGGGTQCQGDNLEVTRCSNTPCLMDFSWGSWEAWSVCSASCGGGIRRRQRICNEPTTSNGRRYCPGSDTQEDYCNLDLCPINGGWSSWSPWGACTATCGGGQMRRFRTCDSPPPSQGGRACTGSDVNTESCNTHQCPVTGGWGAWGEWSSCSETCGIGVRMRTRVCDGPYHPSVSGSACSGEDTEKEECNGELCKNLPVFSRGTLQTGELNGEDLGVVSVMANISRLGMQRTVTGNVSPLTPKHASWLTPLLSLLSPIHWLSAYEINGAVNGHTLTGGLFRQETHVAYATGETVDITHVVRGVDTDGALLMDIQVTGNVPYLPPDSPIKLHPYTEFYVQTGRGSLFAVSTRAFSLGKHQLPYAWNKTVSYDVEGGSMPYLVETLHLNDIVSSYSNTKQELVMSASAFITPGTNGQSCPSGFTLYDPAEPYCQDNNECETSSNRCSHGCTNTVGSYACTCTPGFTLGPDGYTCQDMDECSMTGVCGPHQHCENTPGSYTCNYACGHGLRRTSSGSSCEDINECEEQPEVCDQTCLNLIGGYRCDCRRGFRLIGQSRCEDINECSKHRSPCSHGCQNTQGSFRCTCPDGYNLLPNGRCKDIDECKTNQHECMEEQECKNTDGSYTCITHCPPGLKQANNVSCTDIDECTERLSGCHYTQICTNTWGSYVCSCAQGFRSAGPGQPCRDVNECLASPSPCSYRCHNLRGTYQCVCAPGQQRLPDGKSCVGLQYLEESHTRPLLPSRHPTRPASPGYPTSAFQENLLHNFYLQNSCPSGFEYFNEECQDIDECRLSDRCQHQCHNTYGSFICLCPPGYRLNHNQRTCDDIDECIEQSVQCGVDEICFNQRGSYKCVAMRCPPGYQKDLPSGSCILDCRRGGVRCPPGVNYAHILAFKTASLPAGIKANQDLVRLMAYDQLGNLVPQTLFTIIENNTGVRFRITVKNGRGILRTLQPLISGREYRMIVEAVSYDEREHFIKYSTRFIIFLHISEYPY